MKTYIVQSWEQCYQILWNEGVATGDDEGEYDDSPEYQWRKNFEQDGVIEVKTSFGYIEIQKDAA